MPPRPRVTRVPTVVSRDSRILPSPIRRTSSPAITGTAMVIVVEENQAQAYSVNRESALDALGDLLTKTGLGDLKLELPGWLKQAIKQSGSLADKLVRELRRALASTLLGILKEIARGNLFPAGVTPSQCQRAVMDGLALAAVGPKPGKVFMDRYGEEVVAGCLRDMAVPFYEKVIVLTDRDASYSKFRSTLEELNRDGYKTDILLDIHGCSDTSELGNSTCEDGNILVFTDGGISPQKIKEINGGQPMNLNAVYMVSCWGSNFNETWRSLGAKAVNGSKELNYYVLLSPLIFMALFAAGRPLKDAAARAYEIERSFVNGSTFKFKLSAKVNIGGVKVSKTAVVRVGVTWENLINRQLGKVYGRNGKAVNNVPSSKRVHAGSVATRCAGV